MTPTQEKLFNLLSDPSVRIKSSESIYEPYGNNGLSRNTGNIKIFLNTSPHTMTISRNEYVDIIPEILVMRAL